MENLEKNMNEKPKGNMLQNENREDEAVSADETDLKPNAKVAAQHTEDAKPIPHVKNDNNIQKNDPDNSGI